MLIIQPRDPDINPAHSVSGIIGAGNGLTGICRLQKKIPDIFTIMLCRILLLKDIKEGIRQLTEK